MDELQLVTKPDDALFDVEYNKDEKRGGKVEHLIKWRGYPESSTRGSRH